MFHLLIFLFCFAFCPVWKCPVVVVSVTQIIKSQKCTNHGQNPDLPPLFPDFLCFLCNLQKSQRFTWSSLHTECHSKQHSLASKVTKLHWNIWESTKAGPIFKSHSNYNPVFSFSLTVSLLSYKCLEFLNLILHSIPFKNLTITLNLWVFSLLTKSFNLQFNLLFLLTFLQ